MVERQTRGMIAIAVILSFIPLVGFFYPSTFTYPILSTSNKDSLIIEIDAEDGPSGVFFVGPKTTAKELLCQLQVVFDGKQDFPLQNAMKIRLLEERGGQRILVEKMAAANRLALGLPMDVNSPGQEELELVPGLGRKTAAGILALRREIGRFESLEQLTRIKGIKEKKLSKIRPYLYIEDAPP